MPLTKRFAEDSIDGVLASLRTLEEASLTAVAYPEEMLRRVVKAATASIRSNIAGIQLFLAELPDDEPLTPEIEAEMRRQIHEAARRERGG